MKGKRWLAAFMLLGVAVLIAAPASAQFYMCWECSQICWPLRGCEYFCTLADDLGYERCYDSVSYCQQFERCAIIIV